MNIENGSDLSNNEQFNILISGYEGPIDLLLELAKKQKVDLSEISILELAEQYINFIEKFNKIHLEIAADYLVMAAWLTYLKSRLLLPLGLIIGSFLFALVLDVFSWFGSTSTSV